MRWHLAPFAAFDLETTGVDVETAHVVTASLVIVHPNRDRAWDVDVRRWLVAVEIDIPDGAAKIHGITTEQARRVGAPPRDVLDELADLLAQASRGALPLVIANAPYDLTVLDRGCARLGLPSVAERLGRAHMPVLDVMVLDRAADRWRKGSRKLGDLAAHYGVVLDQAHDAAADALAAARVAWRLGQLAHDDFAALPATVPAVASARRDPGVERGYRALRGSPDALHARQVAWRREQALGLERSFRQRGKDDKVDPSWPMVPRPWRVDEAGYESSEASHEAPNEEEIA